MLKLIKAARLLSNLHFMRALILRGVAAAVEHLEVIRYTGAACLVDVGANKGQFSLAFRALRPSAQIIAFEPLPDAGDTYLSVLGNDLQVTLQRFALANRDGEAEFFVTNRSDSSSLLVPGEVQAEAFEVREERRMRVPVKRLGDILSLASLPHPLLLKIDVQGAELDVLKGCDDLEQADFVHVELSFVELYVGQPLHEDVAAYLRMRGFELAGIFNQVMTERFGPTQADFLFRRAKSTAPAEHR